MSTEKKKKNNTYTTENKGKLCQKDWIMYACVYDVFVCVWKNGGVCMLRKMLAAQQEKTTKEENRHFERPSLVSSVCCSLCTGKIELYVSWAAYFRGVLPWLQRTTMKPAGFACTGTISRVIVKVTSSSDLEKIRVRSKSTRRQACRFQQRGLLRTLNKQFWER